MRIGILAAAFCALFAGTAAASGYLPPKGNWKHQAPASEGLDAGKLQAAIDFAIANETKFPPGVPLDARDMRLKIPLDFAHEPFSDPIGPLKPRAPINGLIIRHGYIVAEWGDTHAVDMTHSISKTFLSSVAGVAFDKHMIRNVNDRVIDYVQPTPDFTLPHNRAHHLGPDVAPDLWLDRHDVGQAVVGGSSRQERL